MGQIDRTANLLPELPHGGAMSQCKAYPGYPYPQASIAGHYGFPKACAITADLGGE